MISFRLKRQERHKKTSYINIRLTDEEKNLIKKKANLYALGSITEFVTYAALHFEPQNEDLDLIRGPEGPQRRNFDY